MTSKFLGDTKGNRDLPTNRSSGGGGSHSPAGAGGGKFVGPTKGNTDLPINRSAGGGK
jgi:hypothetical protein